MWALVARGYKGISSYLGWTPPFADTERGMGANPDMYHFFKDGDDDDSTLQ